jgi:hypothetical protein
MRSVWVAVALLSSVKMATAHTFVGGAGYYDQFTDGVTVIVIYPAILLPLIALGLFLSLWDHDGLPRALPFFFISQLIGICAAMFVGEFVLLFLMAVGMITAGLGALYTNLSKTWAYLVAGLTGCSVLLVALEGHSLFELPIFTYLGLLFGSSLVVMVSAGLARLTLDTFNFSWVRVGLRVMCSWVGAILVFMIAFELSLVTG